MASVSGWEVVPAVDSAIVELSPRTPDSSSICLLQRLKLSLGEARRGRGQEGRDEEEKRRRGEMRRREEPQIDLAVSKIFYYSHYLF